MKKLKWYYIKLDDREYAISRSVSFCDIFVRGLSKEQAEYMSRMHNLQVDYVLQKMSRESSTQGS